MTSITNSSTRLAALVAGVAVALALMGAVAVAPAQAAGLSASQVQAIVSLLASFGADQGTINNVTAALNGQATSGSGSTGGSSSTGGACPVLTRSLQLGSSGADVMSLQKFLNASANTRVAVSGAGSPGMETTYFGPATQAAVIKFQAANNVSAIGVVGPATRAAIAAVCGTTGGSTGGTGSTGGSTSLQGGEGQLTDIDNISAEIESEIDEGQTDNVYGLEMDAEDSDVMIERVDVQFTLSDADTTQSDNLDDYVTEVSLMLDGKELASMDVDEADEQDAGDGDFDSDADANGNDVYEFRFSGLKGIIREDDTARLYVAVTAVNNVDSTDATGDWYVNIPEDGIRAVDAAGISDTYVTSSESTKESFRVGEADAGDIDVSANASDNEDRIITVSADNDTDGEEILAFSIESQSSDNNITDIVIGFSTTTSTSTLVQTAVKQVHLYQGSTKLASADVEGTLAGDETATFDDLDIDIDEDEEVEFTIEADFYDEADEREGFSFEAFVDVSGMEAEDSEGDDVSNINGGTDATGGEIELRTTGIMAAFKSADEVRTNGSIAGDPDNVDFTIKFSVTAVGDDDIWLDGDTAQATTTAAATDGLQWATTSDSSTGTSTAIAGVLTADDGYQSDDRSTSGSKYFKIESGETRNFTFRVNIPAGSDNTAAGIQINSLKWGTSVPTNNDGSANVYDFDMSDWTTDTITGLYVR